jgi:hypothetical protein
MSKGLMDYLFVCSLSALGGMFYLINHPMQNLIVNNIFLGAFLAFSTGHRGIWSKNMSDNPEREWTVAEREEFFASQDAVTWNQKFIPDGARIVITSIVPPEQGWPIAMHCPICKVTTFLLSPWAIKPEKGDYWKMNDVCASDEHFHEHNMRIAMKSFDWSITRVLG